MPNWCEGTLRIRGTWDNIKKVVKAMFLENTVAGTDPRVTISEETDSLLILNANSDAFYINGTHRNFIFDTEIAVEDFAKKPGQEFVVIINHFEAAWGVDADPYFSYSNDYFVDIKIVGFEKGMQFEKVVELVKGKIIRNEVIKFVDYDWECPCPNLGG